MWHNCYDTLQIRLEIAENAIKFTDVTVSYVWNGFRCMYMNRAYIFIKLVVIVIFIQIHNWMDQFCRSNFEYVSIDKSINSAVTET